MPNQEELACSFPNYRDTHALAPKVGSSSRPIDRSESLSFLSFPSFPFLSFPFLSFCSLHSIQFTHSLFFFVLAFLFFLLCSVLSMVPIGNTTTIMDMWMKMNDSLLNPSLISLMKHPNIRSSSAIFKACTERGRREV